jgi:hypothetical protein
MYGQICGSGLKLGLTKYLDSRDSVAPETWFEIWFEKDIRLWFETWFDKVVLETWFEIWFEKDIRTDIRLRFATDVRIDIRADVRADKRTALGHAPLLIRTRGSTCENKKTPERAPAKGKPNTSRGLRGNQDGERSRRALAHSGRGAYCRLRAPAADQCLKKISSHGHWSQARGLTPAGTQAPSTEQR